MVPAKASRTLADAAAFVEAEGIAADAAYTEALNAAQAQEAHQVQRGVDGGGGMDTTLENSSITRTQLVVPPRVFMGVFCLSSPVRRG